MACIEDVTKRRRNKIRFVEVIKNRFTDGPVKYSIQTNPISVYTDPTRIFTRVSESSDPSHCSTIKEITLPFLRTGPLILLVVRFVKQDQSVSRSNPSETVPHNINYLVFFKLVCPSRHSVDLRVVIWIPLLYSGSQEEFSLIPLVPGYPTLESLGSVVPKTVKEKVTLFSILSLYL